MMDWIFRGRAHVFGNDIPLDDGLIPFSLAIGRVTDAEKLIPHLFEDVSPGFSDRVKAGDIVVAGTDFACGKPHAQGFIALQALGVGVVCETMPFNSIRAGVSSGLAFMTGCEDVADLFTDGDEIEVDFATGRVTNHTRATHRDYAPLDPSLRDVIAAGGSRGLLRKWWADKNAAKTAE